MVASSMTEIIMWSNITLLDNINHCPVRRFCDFGLSLLTE